MKLRNLNCFHYVIVTLGLLSLTHVATADEWIVSADGNGHFSDIQSAVDIANDGDQITVLPGVYVAAAGADYVVDISNKTLFIVSAGGPTITRIDGQYQRGCLRWTGQGANPGLIQGFMLNAGAVGAGEGGGLRLQDASPAVETCEIQNCSAKFGGGLYALTSNYTLTSCNVSFNTATNRGGAIRNSSSQPTITDCTFTQNTGGERGGAIHAQNNSGGTFIDCDFINNTCTSLGGAVVDNGGSDSSYYSCTFNGNSSTGASGGQGRGGASFSDSSFVLFDGCTFENNAASSVGGAIYNWNSAGVCVGGSITGNTASDGGAIYTYHASFSQDVIGTTICGNSLSQVYGNWTDLGGSCVVDNCDDLADDDDGDGIPNGCDPCPDWPYECSDDGQTVTVQPGQDIQLAVDTSVTGGIVVLAAGPHPWSGISLNGMAITLRGEVGAGGELLSIVLGSGGVSILRMDSGETSSTRIEQLHLKSGSTNSDGGGLYIAGSAPVIENCMISDCSAGLGGGVYVDTGSPQFNGVTFAACSASLGGGVYVRGAGSAPTFDDCVFVDNSSVAKGGGLRLYSDASSTLSSCLFDGNDAGSEGGGLHVQGAGGVILAGCTFDDNSAIDGGGAALHSAVSFNACFFESNVAVSSGGGLYIKGTQSQLDLCDFMNNTAAMGGGMRTVDDQTGPTLSNAQFCENTPDNLSGPFVGGGDNCLAELCTDLDNDGIFDECDSTPPGDGIDGPLVDGSWIVWNNNRGAHEGFTTACDVSGTLAAFRSPKRGVAIYERDAASGDWSFEGWVTPGTLPGDNLNDRFGYSVALDGDRLVVGAPGLDVDEDGSREGGVYYFHRQGSGQWDIVNVWGAPDGAAGSEFGYKVGVSGDKILATAPGIGVVYFYTIGSESSDMHVLRDTGNGRLIGALRRGEALAFDMPYAAISTAAFEGSENGSVQIYNMAGTPSLEATVQDEDWATGGYGRSLAIDSGGLVVVGTGWLRQVWMYRRGDDVAWSSESKIQLSGVATGPNAGNINSRYQDFAVNGDNLYVADGDGGGIVRHYLYSAATQSWLARPHIATVIPTGLTIATDGDIMVSVDPHAPLPNDPTGSASSLGVLLHRSADGVWGEDYREVLPLVFTDTSIHRSSGGGGGAIDSGSIAVTTLDGRWAFVCTTEYTNNDAITLRIYHDDGTGWQHVETDTFQGNGLFSPALSAEGNRFVLGIGDASNSGKLHCYEYDGTEWIQQQSYSGQQLKDLGLITSGRLGFSVDMNGDWMVAGSPGMPLYGDYSSSTAVFHWDSVAGEWTPLTGIDHTTASELGGWATAIRANVDGTATVACSAHEVQTGAVTIHEIAADGAVSLVDVLYAPNGGGLSDFGRELALDGNTLAVGCIGGGPGQVGAAVYTLGDDGHPTLQDTVSTYGRSNSYSQLFIREQISLEDGLLALATPFLSYLSGQGGGITVFSQDGTHWRVQARLAAQYGQVNTVFFGIINERLGTGVVIHDGHILAATSPGMDPVALDFTWDPTRVFWTSTTRSALNGNDAWGTPPLQSDTGVFAQWLADTVLVDWRNDVVSNIDVAMCDVRIDCCDAPVAGRTLSGDVLLASPVNMGIGRLVISQPGLFSVGGSTVVGQGDLSGRLALRGGATLHTAQLTVAASSAMDLDLAGGSNSVTVNDPPIIAGTLRVSLGAIDPGSLEEGDSFTMIQSAAAPLTGEGKFDLIVLPGLPDGLAFQTEYVEGLRGGWVVNVNVVSLAGLLNFGSPANLPVTGQPTAVEVVDLTGDGAEEICVTFAGSPGQLMIFENDGAGGVAQQIVLPTGDMPIDVTSGDFDGDLRMDLAVANNLSLDVTLYYNDDDDPSNGMVTAVLNVAGPPTCLAGINANYDAPDDLVVGLADTDGDGNGFWAIYTGTLAVQGTGGGMNGGGGAGSDGEPVFGDPSDDEDQKPEVLFVGGTSRGRASVGRNGSMAGLQGFSLIIDEYDAGADPQGLAYADLNGDGRSDIILSSGTNGSVAVLLADPATSSTFLPALQVPIGDSPTRVTTVDFDQDGNMDLAVIVDSDGDSRVRVLQNDGSMSFASIDTAEGEGVVLLDSGDISGDGVSELVTIGGGSALRGLGDPILSLRPLNSATTCSGDADATGFVDIEDLLVVLSEFGTCPSGCAADFDDDGDVDVDDMLVVIGNWGPCPRQ